MILKTLGSSSLGNCYILESKTEALIIEAGISFKEVKKALNFNISKIQGVVVSHMHQDHAKYISEYKKAGIVIFKPWDDIISTLSIKLGDFYIQAFPLIHDVSCYGYIIQNKELGKLLFATDTEYIKYRFKNLNHILVEANYSKECIDSSRANYVHQITDHMEIETTCKFLEVNSTPNLRNVLLLHLSNNSSNAKDFKAKVEKVVDCTVCVADSGLEVDLMLEPF